MDRAPDVRVVGGEPIDPDGPIVRRLVLPGGEREGQEGLRVAPPGVGLVAVGREALGRDGLNRLQHPESHTRLGREPLDQALAGQLGEVVEGIEGGPG